MLRTGEQYYRAAGTRPLDRTVASGLMQRTIEALRVPHKTGATDSVRTECALFYLQSRVVACGFTKQNTDIRWVVDNEAQMSLGKIGAVIVTPWPRR